MSVTLNFEPMTLKSRQCCVDLVLGNRDKYAF